MKRLIPLIFILFIVGCASPLPQDPLVSIYWSVSEDSDGWGLEKSYIVDSANLEIKLHWPNPETGKEQQLARVTPLSQTESSQLLTQIDSLAKLLEAPWAIPFDSVLSCSSCEKTQILFRLQTQQGKIFRLAMPEDYPYQHLPFPLQQQLQIFKNWVKTKEIEQPILE